MDRSQNTYQILIAEDNPADVLLIKEALDTHGVPCHVHSVDNGQEFLAYAREACDEETAPKPDLIILDWSLPKGSGTELVKAIRETERCADALIFVLTSSISPHDRVAAEVAGANRFISKPTELDEFLGIGALIRQELMSRN